MLGWKRAYQVLIIVALALAAMLLSAQSRRGYQLGQIWWDAGRNSVFPLEEDYDNPTGAVSILNTQGAVQPEGHPFFEALGKNGRACITCHQPSNAMSLSTASLHERWTITDGKDPVFAAIDGSNCPDLPQDAMSSHSLLLDRGLIRIALPWPPRTDDGKMIQTEFRIEVVQDPTGCNKSHIYGLSSAHPMISVYRRPRVVANFKYATGLRLMTDGREPSLKAQAITAALVHEQAQTQPTEEQLRQIVNFENQVFAAQSADMRGGLLNENVEPLLLGPENLAEGDAPLLNGLSGSAHFSFDIWKKPKEAGDWGAKREFRASVARGSEVFFAHSFPNQAGFAVGETIPARVTCATCHQASAIRWMDIGSTNRAAQEASTDLPLFRITCNSSATPHPLYGRVIYTQDPGRALISGKCADVGSIVMQQLRGLSARAPYFSNGGAQSLDAVVDFYDRRFHIGYTGQEKQDLVNFLSVL